MRAGPTLGRRVRLQTPAVHRESALAMKTHTPRLLPLRAACVKHWLRLLLLCSVFSAVHVPLGAWVVAAVSDGPTVQICTPQGLQWVSLTPGDPQPEHQALAQQPCVWAGAHVAINPPTGTGLTAAAPAYTPVVGLGRGAAAPTDRVRCVLLMSAMRAPPLRA